MNGDLISREALKKAMNEEALNLSNGGRIFIENINKIIDNAPTVEVTKPQSYVMGFCDGLNAQTYEKPPMFERPQGEWIPVSERLPNDRDWYLGLFKEPDTDFIGIPYICDYVGEVTKGTTNDGWILRHCTDVDNASDYFRNLICVAWQPLPEPYKKGGAE